MILIMWLKPTVLQKIKKSFDQKIMYLLTYEYLCVCIVNIKNKYVNLNKKIALDSTKELLIVDKKLISELPKAPLKMVAGLDEQKKNKSELYLYKTFNIHTFAELVK